MDLLQRTSCLAAAILAFGCLLNIVPIEPASAPAGRSSRALANMTKVKCTLETKAEMDLTMLKLLSYGPKGREFPENREQVRAFCAESQMLTDKLTNYINDCLKKDVRDASNLFMFTIRGAIKRFCKKGQSKRLDKLLESTPCNNKYLRPNYSCFRTMIDQGARSMHFPDKKLRIPYACCYYQQFLGCMEGLINKNKCLRKYKELTMDFIKSITEGLTNTMCTEYDDSTDKCDKLPPLPASVKASNDYKYETIILVLVDMFSSL